MKRYVDRDYRLVPGTDGPASRVGDPSGFGPPTQNPTQTDVQSPLFEDAA